MNIDDFYKQKEYNKISDEIAQESTYYKDIIAYSDLSFARGFVACMKCMSKEDRNFLIEFFKDKYDKEKDKSQVKSVEYLLRLCNDEFKVVEF